MHARCSGMKKICGPFILFFFAVSCKKDNPVTISGNYAGTYTHTYGSIDSTTTIRMKFVGDRFSGESDNPRYPRICEGGYGISGNNIGFGNDCNVPGDNPQSMVLYGHYQLSLTGDSLIFGRGSGDIVYDAELYRLKKQ